MELFSSLLISCLQQTGGGGRDPVLGLGLCLTRRFPGKVRGWCQDTMRWEVAYLDSGRELRRYSRSATRKLLALGRPLILNLPYMSWYYRKDQMKVEEEV